MHPADGSIDAHSNVIVTWAHDAHVSTFSTEWLLANDYSNGARHAHPEPTLWDGSIGNAVPLAQYPELLQSTEVRRDFLRQFVDYGVGVLHDVPCVPGTVLDVGRLLEQLQRIVTGQTSFVRFDLNVRVDVAQPIAR